MIGYKCSLCGQWYEGVAESDLSLMFYYPPESLIFHTDIVFTVEPRNKALDICDRCWERLLKEDTENYVKNKPKEE